jgi:hypothetical protein
MNHRDQRPFRPEEVLGPERGSDRSGDADSGESDPSGVASADSILLTAMAADLEALAREPSPKPSAGFADLVSAAILRDPVPVPIAAAGLAFRRHNVPGFAAAVRDSVRVSLGRGRPVTARAGAFAMLVVALLAALSVGAVIAVGAAAVLVPAPHETHHVVPATPSITIMPTTTPAPERTSEPSPTARPSHGPVPSPTDGEVPVTSETPRATSSLNPSSTPTASPRPTGTDADTSAPTDQPAGDGSGGGGSGGSGEGQLGG